MLLIGLLVATCDHRHNTATATCLITPRRGRVLAAKAATVVVCGLTATVVGGIITAAVGLPLLAAGGLTLADPVQDLAVGLGLSAAFVVFSGLLAFAVATMVRDQVRAVFAVFGLAIGSWTVLGFVPAVGQWLPYPAFTSLLVGGADPSLLPVWAGGLVLLGWAVVLGSGAFWRARRDIA